MFHLQCKVQYVAWVDLLDSDNEASDFEDVEDLSWAHVEHSVCESDCDDDIILESVSLGSVKKELNALYLKEPDVLTAVDTTKQIVRKRPAADVEKQKETHSKNKGVGQGKKGKETGKQSKGKGKQGKEKGKNAMHKDNSKGEHQTTGQKRKAWHTLQI